MVDTKLAGAKIFFGLMPRKSVMMKTFLNLVSTLALCGTVVFLAIPNAFHGELVLCIGQDGHLEIEYAEAGKCVDCLIHNEHHSTPALTTGLSTDHCGACNDIRLAKQEFQARQGTGFSSVEKINSLPPVKMPPSIWRDRASFFKNTWFQTRGAPAISFLRTIRLII